jgi:acyl-homoserine lactone acylase PvdQ
MMLLQKTISLLHRLLIVALTLASLSPVLAASAATAGDLKPEQIAASVTIYRDTYGVPHIYGPTDASVVFGLAYAQAEDNFWQIEDGYIRALGRAAEVYGEKELQPMSWSAQWMPSDFRKMNIGLWTNPSALWLMRMPGG